MRLQVVLLGLWTSSVSAINLLSGIPQCASTPTLCTPISGTNTNCATNYEPLNCFCISLPGLASQPYDLCPSCSTSQEQTQLTNWYNSKCSQGSSTTKSTTSTSSVPGATSTPSSTTTSTGSQHTGTSGNASSSQTGHQSWWDKHGKYIIMVIVLAIGFAIIIAVGVFLKRRHDLKHNQTPQLPNGAAWAPNTSQLRSNQASNSGYPRSNIDDDPPMRQTRSIHDHAAGRRLYAH